MKHFFSVLVVIATCFSSSTAHATLQSGRHASPFLHQRSSHLKVNSKADCKELFLDAVKGVKKKKGKIRFNQCLIKLLKRKTLKRAIKKGNLGAVIQVQNKINQLEAKVAALLNEEAVAKKRGNFGGTWSTNLGTTVIAQFDNGTISGSWTDPGSGDIGTLSGTVTGLSLAGSWTYNGTSGSFVLSLKSKNAGAFQGYCGAAGAWIGNR